MTQLVRVFVPVPLTNPMNGSHGHWTKHRRWAKSWRERVAFCVMATGWRGNGQSSTPKLVTFTAYVGNEWDDDNLRAALKPSRDALVDCGLIHDDRPSAGHTFVYAQEIRRGRTGVRGVEITVERVVEDGARG